MSVTVHRGRRVRPPEGSQGSWESPHLQPIVWNGVQHPPSPGPGVGASVGRGETGRASTLARAQRSWDGPRTALRAVFIQPYFLQVGSCRIQDAFSSSFVFPRGMACDEIHQSLLTSS